MDVRLPDGTIIRGVPDGTTREEVLAFAKSKGVSIDAPKEGAPEKRSTAERLAGTMTPAGIATSLASPEGREDLKAAGMGFLRGAKDVVDTGAQLLASGYDKVAGTSEGQRVADMNQAGKQEFAQQYGGDTVAQLGRVGGNIAATAPVGPAMGLAARGVGLTRLGTAMATGGATTGAQVAPTVAGRAVDMGIRMAGGAATGAAGAGLVDPEAVKTGAIVGAAIPPVSAVAGRGGELLASLVRPFTRGGQERIAGDTLRQFSTNPEAVANLRAAGEMVPGSAPTAVMAAGDEGLAGLSRTLQSADPRYAAELSSRMTAQNAARTAALEDVAGNTGRLDLARGARDAATGPMREAVLDAAGNVPARSVLDSIDRMLANPNNAGRISQQALSEFRNRIAQNAPDGQINARALYAIRKDINDVLGGRLQGEAGNLRYAAGQLRDVKSLIDDAIDQGSRRVEMSSSRALMPAGANIERAGAAPLPNAGPRPTWQGYLTEYQRQSVPINQMERLDDVMRSISTGSVDAQGNAILSAAKLNNLLRNQGRELQQVLAPEQMDLLRRMAADLNASQLASTAGKAVGSNTVQNLAGVNMLQQVLGNRLGGSATAQSLMGRMLQLPYGASNRMIQDRLGAALLDPQEAARLMATPEGNALVRALTGAPAQIGYRAAPALAAQ